MRRRADFQNIYAKGRAIRGEFLVVIAHPNDQGRTRCAFVASGKVGGAVRRNRCKRLLREAYRLLRSQASLDGLDLILIARPRCTGARIDQVIEDLKGLYRSTGMWKEAAGSPSEERS